MHMYLHMTVICVQQRINFDTWEKMISAVTKDIDFSKSYVRCLSLPLSSRDPPCLPFLCTYSSSSWKVPGCLLHSPGGYNGDKLSHLKLLKTTDSFRVKGIFKFTDHLSIRGRCIVLSPLFSCWLSCLKCCSSERLTSGLLSFLLLMSEEAGVEPCHRPIRPHDAIPLQSSYPIVLGWIKK